MKQIITFLLVALTIKASSQQVISVDTVYNADSTSSYVLLHYETNPITINIPPIVKGNSIIMRKAKVFTMIYHQEMKFVSVSTKIVRYAFTGVNFSDTSYLDDSNYGNIIDEDVKKGVEILATNRTLVNPLTGEIIDNPSNGQTVCGQYDFFYNLSKYQPILVNGMIAIYLQQNTEWGK